MAIEEEVRAPAGQALIVSFVDGFRLADLY